MQKIIAAGGHSGIEGDGGFSLNTVEVYDISLNTWETGVYDNDHINGHLGKEHSQMSVQNPLKMFQVPASLIHFMRQPLLSMALHSKLLVDTASPAVAAACSTPMTRY